MGEIDGPIVDSIEVLEHLRNRIPSTLQYLSERLQNVPQITAEDMYFGGLAIDVNMENYGISSEGGVIGTKGVGDCVGVILYDSSRHVATAVHLNASTDPFLSIQEMMEKLGIQAPEIEAYVWGGIVDTTFPLSAELARRTVSALDKSNVRIAGANLLTKGPARVDGLFIDTSNGRLYLNGQNFQHVSSSSLEGTGEAFSTKATLAYDGRQI